VPDLASFLGEHGVAKFKYPERVVMRTALPRNVTGKVLKHILQQEYASGQTESSA